VQSCIFHTDLAKFQSRSCPSVHK